MNSFDEVFAAVKEYCKERVVGATYDLFIGDIEPISFDGNSAELSVRSEFVKNTLENRYLKLLKEGFQAILGFEPEIHLIVPVSEPTPAPAAAAATDNGGSYPFTFENFIVGSTNKFANAAAQAVAANPSGAYNPLFIWGGSGLGKTHLLSAIQVEIRKNHPDFNIVYVDGEKFTNEIISAIHDNTTAQFHNKYRAADVLLVDDIQFIGGKESTQEEFFHTFNTLYNADKQIVLASDRTPREIKSLEERLRTRIIRRKADLLNLEMPDEVAEFIANRLKNNIRQLEGAVKKLAAYRQLEGIQPVLGAAQNAIKDILSEDQPAPVTVEKILGEVARTYNTSPDVLRGLTRKANISSARQVSMFIVREITGMSMEEIGREFSGRDHSTVVYSINAIQKRLDTDTRLKETVEDIIKNVRT